MSKCDNFRNCGLLQRTSCENRMAHWVAALANSRRRRGAAFLYIMYIRARSSCLTINGVLYSPGNATIPDKKRARRQPILCNISTFNICINMGLTVIAKIRNH